MLVAPGDRTPLTVTVNGIPYEAEVETRWLLSDVLRHVVRLTGTHVGCEHGVCGCCTVLINGRPARSCLMLAVQAEGAEITTVEGLAGPNGELHPLQESFRRHHGLQCGFCTPGFLMTALPIYERAADMSDDELRDAIGGQLCRCTGYAGILEAIRGAAAVEEQGGGPGEPLGGLSAGRFSRSESGGRFREIRSEKETEQGGGPGEPLGGLSAGEFPRSESEPEEGPA
jgi:aerobic carbon-monoxide dehydrogenase small subunit